MENSGIGKIEVFDDFSTVDLLAGMPPKVFNALKQAYVLGQRLNISRLNEVSASDQRPASKKPKTKKRPKQKEAVAEV